MRALEIPLYSAIGILEAMWNLSAREAPQGNIGKLSDADISDALGWDGDPKRLIDALVESGWLERCCAEHRLIVHDWHDHADEAVKKALQRSKLSFLSISVATCRDKNRLPEPSQSLAKPEPVGKPPAAAVATPPAKLSPSPGSNGEFMLAQELGREIKLAMRAGDIALVAQVIANETPEHGDGLRAKNFIRDKALEARARGEPVTLFWLQDRKFEKTQLKDIYQQFREADV